MTDQEILKKAIEKAVKGGYGFTKINFTYSNGLIDRFTFNAIDDGSYYKIIFSHDFAKAFWGEGVGWVCMGCGTISHIEVDVYEKCRRCKNQAKTLTIWAYHLQEMVLEKEPLKYLERFIK